MLVIIRGMCFLVVMVGFRLVIDVVGDFGMFGLGIDFFVVVDVLGIFVLSNSRGF